MRIHRPLAVRWMKPTDLDRVVELDRQTHEEAHWNRSTLTSMMKTDGLVVLVHVRGAVDGYLAYRIEARHLEIIRVGVDPHQQRRGVGRALLGALGERVAENPRFNRLACSVSERDTSIHHWLKACGFRAVRVDRGCGVWGEDSYRFVRRRSM